MFKIQPWDHQLEAMRRARSLSGFALFFSMGTGKSGTVINILRTKILDRKKEDPLAPTMLKTLIFCPPIVVKNWKAEFALHSNIDPKNIILLSGSGKQRLDLFQKHSEQPAIFVTNYESLLMKDLYKAFQTWAPEAIVFDESHKLKNYKAARSKLAEKLANPPGNPPLKYILSGSPVLNSPMDLFHQFLILDGGATFSKNFFIFRARYFIDKNAGMPKDRYFPNWVVRPGALDEINAKIFRAGMRVTKEECLDLPDETSVMIKCDMTKPQAKNYAEMKKDFIAFVGTETASAQLAIVKALRLMQITAGFLPLTNTGSEDEQAREVYKDTPKEENLKELLEELTPHSKVIVWAVWKENYATIRKVCDELGVGYVEVHGGISRAKQDAAVERFKTDPSARVFIGHPGSGGIGINLVVAPYSIFYSRTFSLEHWLQARARNHRGGQTQKVTHYDLVCENTIDELVQQKLALKQDLSESLLKQLAQEMETQSGP